MMLQQTTVERVIPKYISFLKKFPSFEKLARAPQKDVILLWQGLGYNRRALYVHQAAKMIVQKYGRSLPKERKELESLPGVGPYTAGALRVFVHGMSDIVIETNIRGAYLHSFFQKKEKVPDKEILPLVEKTLDRKNPREWYFALMDFGAMLKRTTPNPSRKSLHHHVQAPFLGSRRQVRGKILKIVIERGKVSLLSLARLTGEKTSPLQALLSSLEKEGFISIRKDKISLR